MFLTTNANIKQNKQKREEPKLKPELKPFFWIYLL